MKNLDLNMISMLTSILAPCVLVIFILMYYTTNQSFKKDELMSKNIETAISKGVDPLAVRCSYAASTDQICIMYAAGMKTITSASK